MAVFAEPVEIMGLGDVQLPTIMGAGSGCIMGLASLTDVDAVLEGQRLAAGRADLTISLEALRTAVQSYDKDTQGKIGRAFLDAGGNVGDINYALSSPYSLNMISRSPAAYIAGSLIATASAAASAYHGYKRNDSVGWAIVWFLLGGMFPVITPVIAVAQGFGKKKRN